MQEKLVEIKNLKVSFFQDGILTPVVREVSMDVFKGETLGLVGESGCGKSITAKSIMKLIPDPPGKINGGEVLVNGKNVLEMSEQELQQFRGDTVSMIFQEPMTALNPLYTCGNQIMESLLSHNKISKKEARTRALSLLELVGVPSPEHRMRAYPHELSGGMRQRIMIAMALSCGPKLLIADEPTTALDPTIQAQILRLIKQLQKKLSMSVLLITHDLGIVAENCDRVIVMYAGQIVEIADVRELYSNPAHPYTSGLLKAIPRMDSKVDSLYSIKGAVPRFNQMPQGCAFAPRCPCFSEKCASESPELAEVGYKHYARCVMALQENKEHTCEV